MAPLDTGSLTHHLRLVDPAGAAAGPSPEHYDTLGAYLRAVREHRGLTLNELADATRVRRAYLQAIEDRNRSALPSRPFAIGYVRAYAKALGLDGELAVQRFKTDWPDSDEPLRNPVGVRGDAPARSPLLMVVAGGLLAAVAVWNITQRLMVNDDPKAPALPAALSDPAPTISGALKLAAPVEAPVESTTPAPYATPGLFAPAPEGAIGAPSAASASALSPPAPVFATRAPIQGAAAGPVLLQARRSVALIVRGPDRTIYFARQLQPGEAFRAPLGRGLTADVSEPAAVATYVNNRLTGVLSALQTPLDSLAAAPPRAAAPAPAGGARPAAPAPAAAPSTAAPPT